MPDFRAMFAPQGQEEAKPDFRAAFSQKAGGAVDWMTGYTRSIIGQGMGMGFGDEIEAGALAAVGSGSYDENIERIRGEQEKFSQDNPVISTGAEIAGGMVPAVVSRGRTVPATVARAAGRGMAEGAGYGAAYGFGTGEGAEDRAAQSVAGGAIGAGIGFATAPLAEGARWLGGHVARPVVSAVRGYLKPVEQGSKEVARAIEADRALGQGLTQQQDALATYQTGQPVMNLDRGGARTRQLARSAASVSPDANAAINRGIDDRFQGQGERINSWLRTNTGFSGDVSATREAAETAARAANRPAYVSAYKAGNYNVASPELARLAGAKEVQTALDLARKRGKSVAVADKLPYQPSDRTTIQTWDYAQRELRSMADKAAAAGDKGRARVLNSLRKQLTAELDRIVPEFGTARSGAAKFFGADNALEAGQNFVNMNADVGAVKRQLAKMSPPEQHLFREGFVSGIMDKVNRVRDRANVLQQIWGNAKSREQIATALGPAKAREFEAFMAIEEVMDQSRGSVQRYPGAARQLAEMGIVGAGTGVATGDPWTGLATALAWGGARKATQAVTNKARERTADQIAKMLMSNDPTLYRNALMAISNSKTMMQSLRSYVTSLAAVTAGQAGSSASAE